MRPAIIAAILLANATALRAQPKDIADLFPANTVLYAEVNQPAVVAKDLTAYLKGSVFETHAPGFGQLGNQPGGGIDTNNAGLLIACLSPAMLKEAPKFKGIAGGIVGFDKHGEPEMLFVALTGDSKLPGLLLKAYTSARADIRKLTTFEGIDLMQQHIVQYEEDPLLLPGGGAPAPPKQKMLPVGKVYASQAGLVVIGSNAEIVKEAIRRFKEKEKTPALSAAKPFTMLVEQRADAGLLVLADARRILDQIDRNYKSERDGAPLNWLMLKNVLPPRSVGTLVGRLEINDDRIRLQARLKLDDMNKGPLVKLLEGATLTPGDLNGIHGSSPFALTLALPAEQRANRLLTALDALVSATGTLGPNAGELVDELATMKLLSREDVAKISRVSLAMPPLASWPKNQTPLPTLMLHSDDAATLEKLEAAIPAAVELLGGERAIAIAETIDGVRVRSLGAKLFGHGVHYGHHAGSFALGTDRKVVAEMLRKTVAPANNDPFKDLKNAGLVCAWNWVDMVRGPNAKKPEPGPRRGVSYVTIPQHSSPYYPGGPRREPVRLTKEAVDYLDGLPPLTIALSSQNNELTLEIQQNDPKRLRTKGLANLFDWYVRLSFGFGGGPYSELNVYDGPIDFMPLGPGPIPQPIAPKEE